MNEKTIVRNLRKIAKEKIDCNDEKKAAVIALLMEKEVSVRKKGSFKEFLLFQFSFMNKIVLFWQAAWALTFFYVLWKGKILSISNESLCILSMAPPLLLLLTVEEVSHIYNRSMLEIEYATKYSLKKAVMARMFLLSMINGAVLTAGMLFAKKQLALKILETLVYGLTPLVLMTFLLLLMMKKWDGERLKYAGVSVYILLALAVLIGGREKWNIYRESLKWAWFLLFVFGITAMAYQFRRLMQHLESFELLTGSTGI